MLFPRIPTIWFGSEFLLLPPGQLSSVLESEKNTGRKEAPSSHCGSKEQQQSYADMQPPSHTTIQEPSPLGAAC